MILEERGRRKRTGPEQEVLFLSFASISSKDEVWLVPQTPGTDFCLITTVWNLTAEKQADNWCEMENQLCLILARGKVSKLLLRIIVNSRTKAGKNILERAMPEVPGLFLYLDKSMA